MVTPFSFFFVFHCGVFRSETGGDGWGDIFDGLPARFGFVLAVHPHDGVNRLPPVYSVKVRVIER